MKKLLIGLSLAAGLSTQAATFVSQSLLAQDLYSLALTNTINVTNLNSTLVQSNAVGTVWTNRSGVNGTRVVVANDGTAPQTKNLFVDANLWVGQDGQPILNPVSDAAGIVTNSYVGSIYIRLLGTSGANSAVNFIFVPLPDGEHESTVAGDAFTVAVTAAGATVVDKTVPLPSWKWPGVPKMRLKSATNTDTDATSRVDLLQCSLNGFVP